MDDVSRECWIWYPIVICTVLGRYTSQWVSQTGGRGLGKFRPDDYVMLFVTCTYTIVVVCLYEYQQIQDNVDWDNLDPSSDDYLYYEHLTNRMVLVCETAMQTTLWCNKLCLLLVYKHFTRVTRTDRLWQVSIALLAASFVTLVTVLYTECEPFSDTFLFDPSTQECLTWFRYNILQVILNILTDIYLMVLFWIILVHLNVPLTKKLLLLCIFSLGLFVIAAAILTKVIVFEGLTGVTWVRWYLREVSTAVLIGNLTVCFPLALTIYRYCRTTLSTNFAYLSEKTQSWTRGTYASRATEKRSYLDATEAHSQV